MLVVSMFRLTKVVFGYINIRKMQYKNWTDGSGRETAEPDSSFFPPAAGKR